MWSAVLPGAFSRAANTATVARTAPRNKFYQYLQCALSYLTVKTREQGSTPIGYVLARHALTDVAEIAGGDTLLFNLLRLGHALHEPAILIEPKFEEDAYYAPLTDELSIMDFACPRNEPGTPGGASNSCFADAAIVALFAATDRFDSDPPRRPGNG